MQVPSRGRGDRLHPAVPACLINPLDYRLPIPGRDIVLHPLALGPVDDAVVYVYSNTGGSGLRVDFDAHPDRYTPAEMEAHLRRLLLVVRQVAEGGATFVGGLGSRAGLCHAALRA